MILKTTKDYGLVRKILLESEMYKRISDDYTDPEKFYPSLQTWIGCFTENEKPECVGLLSVTEETNSVLNIHMHIPEKHRGKNSFLIGNGMIEFLIKHRLKRCVKLNIKIPVIYPEVVRFAEKCGFEKEGVDRKSFLKNGEIVDRVILGRCI
jgi:hypothetical protein